MATPITTIFMNWLNPKKIYFWVFLLVICFLAGAIYVYTENIAKVKNNKEFKNIPNAAGIGGDIRIMMFTVDWCPHCRKAKDPWSDFTEAYHQKRINGRLIICEEYNCTEREESDTLYREYQNNEAIMKKHKIDGFPTIIMFKDGERIDFDAKITSYSLERFVEDIVA
jgi:thiol-disulfide isomerase/thioredoxin